VELREQCGRGWKGIGGVCRRRGGPGPALGGGGVLAARESRGGPVACRRRGVASLSPSPSRPCSCPTSSPTQSCSLVEDGVARWGRRNRGWWRALPRCSPVVATRYVACCSSMPTTPVRHQGHSRQGGVGTSVVLSSIREEEQHRGDFFELYRGRAASI
jgi:hypothetical protein